MRRVNGYISDDRIYENGCVRANYHPLQRDNQMTMRQPVRLKSHFKSWNRNENYYLRLALINKAMKWINVISDMLCTKIILQCRHEKKIIKYSNETTLIACHSVVGWPRVEQFVQENISYALTKAKGSGTNKKHPKEFPHTWNVWSEWNDWKDPKWVGFRQGKPELKCMQQAHISHTVNSNRLSILQCNWRYLKNEWTRLTSDEWNVNNAKWGGNFRIHESFDNNKFNLSTEIRMHCVHRLPVPETETQSILHLVNSTSMFTKCRCSSCSFSVFVFSFGQKNANKLF